MVGDGTAGTANEVRALVREIEIERIPQPSDRGMKILVTYIHPQIHTTTNTSTQTQTQILEQGLIVFPQFTSISYGIFCLFFTLYLSGLLCFKSMILHAKVGGNQFWQYWIS